MHRLLVVACALAASAVSALATDVWPCGSCSNGTSPSDCCCMHCGATGTDGPFFSCMAVDACVAAGGQCKHRKTSAYSRPPRARRAGRVAASGEAPEQLHLVADYPEDVTLVFVTSRPGNSSAEVRPASSPDTVKTYFGTRNVYSAMQSGLAASGWAEGWEHGYDDDLFPSPPAQLHHCGPGAKGYTDPNCQYTSGYIHTVKLSGLQPSTVYEYRPHGTASWTSFRTLPGVGSPISFGVLADLGQTEDSLGTMKHLAQQLDLGKLDGVLFGGDLSYADGYADAWDHHGRLGEFLWSRVPTAYITGNHEWEGEQFAHYLPRYPSPSQQRSGSDSPLWYSYEAGLAHVVALCSYCEAREGTPQYEWLQHDLASVDRARTPWLVVMVHVPFYTSNRHHSMEEGRRMREAMDGLLYAHKADVVFAGHMHAYERTSGVYQNHTACDGPVHIVIGDAGNHEGPACPWFQQELPSWGAFREYSFGHGVLEIANATHARWAWHRNQDGAAVNADEVWLKRASLRCGPGSAAPSSASDIII